MTEQEAQRILNEAKSEYPVFIRGRHRFVVRPDGTVTVWDAVGKSGKRWALGPTVDGDTIWIPKEVRERAGEERRKP